MRKILCIVLVIGLVLMGCCLSFADNIESYICDKSLSVMDNNAFEKMFGCGNDTGVIIAHCVISIKTLEESNDLVFVENDCQLFVEDKTYNISLHGNATKSFVNERVFLEGPLYGTITINGQKINIISCFAKWNDTNEILVSLTLQDFINTPVYLYSSMNDLSFPRLEESDDEYSIIIDDPPLDDNPFVLQQTISAYYGSNTAISGYAHQLLYYYNSENGRVALGIKTYCSNLNSYFNQYGFGATFVDDCSYRLFRSNNGNGAIIGIENPSLPTPNPGISAAYVSLISDVFNAILAYFNVSSLTLSSVFGNNGGYVSITSYTNDLTVAFSYNLMNTLNIDAITPGVPIVFQLMRTTQNPTQANFVGQTEVEYRTYFMESGDDGTTILYTSTPSLTVNVSVIL